MAAIVWPVVGPFRPHKGSGSGCMVCVAHSAPAVRVFSRPMESMHVSGSSCPVRVPLSAPVGIMSPRQVHVPAQDATPFPSHMTYTTTIPVPPLVCHFLVCFDCRNGECESWRAGRHFHIRIGLVIKLLKEIPRYVSMAGDDPTRPWPLRFLSPPWAAPEES
jgi:hypothetical protein